MTPYHLGVVQSLRDNDIISSKTRFAGASGGAIAAIVAACNIETEIVLESLKRVHNHSVENGGWGNLKTPLEVRSHLNFAPHSFLRWKILTKVYFKISYHFLYCPFENYSLQLIS